MHVVNFAEAPDTVPQNLREVAPHILLAVPRVWEKLYSGVTIQIKEGTRARPRSPTGPRSAIGYKASAYELEGKPVPALLRAARAIGDWLVLKNIRVVAGAQPHPLGHHRRGADLARSHRAGTGRWA